MLVGHGVWPDQLDAAERAAPRPGVPERLDRAPDVLVVGCAAAATCERPRSCSSNAWLTSGHYKTGILVAPATGQALAEWIRSSAPPDGVEAFRVARLLPQHIEEMGATPT